MAPIKAEISVFCILYSVFYILHYFRIIIIIIIILYMSFRLHPFLWPLYCSGWGRWDGENPLPPPCILSEHDEFCFSCIGVEIGVWQSREQYIKLLYIPHGEGLGAQRYVKRHYVLAPPPIHTGLCTDQLRNQQRHIQCTIYAFGT